MAFKKHRWPFTIATARKIRRLGLRGLWPILKFRLFYRHPKLGTRFPNWKETRKASRM